MAMDNISIELVYELTGKMGATGLANLELPYAVNVRPTPLRVNSGQPAGGYGGLKSPPLFSGATPTSQPGRCQARHEQRQ